MDKKKFSHKKKLATKPTFSKTASKLNHEIKLLKVFLRFSSDIAFNGKNRPKARERSTLRCIAQQASMNTKTL